MVRSICTTMADTVTNRFQVPIRRCCASCLHKVVKPDGTRLCTRAMVIVEPLFCCSFWQMANVFDNIGLKF